MKINLANKFDNNITRKYGRSHVFDSSDLTSKEKSMWRLALWLLKDNYPKEVFDRDKDSKFIAECMDIFFSVNGGERFTFDEWWDYIASK